MGNICTVPQKYLSEAPVNLTTSNLQKYSPCISTTDISAYKQHIQYFSHTKKAHFYTIMSLRHVKRNTTYPYKTLFSIFTYYFSVIFEQGRSLLEKSKVQLKEY